MSVINSIQKSFEVIVLLFVLIVYNFDLWPKTVDDFSCTL